MGIAEFATGLTPFNQQQMDSIQQGVNDVKNTVVTKPGSVGLDVTSVANTWYTLLNVTSGKGVLERIRTSISNYGGTAVQVRVTVDGVLYNLANGFSARNSDSGNTDYFLSVNFKVSIKIEIMATVAAPVSGVVDYGLF